MLLMTCSKCGQTYYDRDNHEIDISRKYRFNGESSPHMVYMFLCPKCGDRVLAWLDGLDGESDEEEED